MSKHDLHALEEQAASLLDQCETVMRTNADLTATVEAMRGRMEHLNNLMTVLCEQEEKIRRGWVDEFAREGLAKRVKTLEQWAKTGNNDLLAKE